MIFLPLKLRALVILIKKGWEGEHRHIRSWKNACHFNHSLLGVFQHYSNMVSSRNELLGFFILFVKQVLLSRPVTVGESNEYLLYVPWNIWEQANQYMRRRSREKPRPSWTRLQPRKDKALTQNTIWWSASQISSRLCFTVCATSTTTPSTEAS